MDLASDAPFAFHHAEKGMTRFPPNVEQVTIERQSGAVWLTARRNDIALRFPLTSADCAHLATLLTEAAGEGGENGR